MPLLVVEMQLLVADLLTVLACIPFLIASKGVHRVALPEQFVELLIIHYSDY